MSYYFSKKIRSGFDQAVERVTRELSKEGFGVLSDIDMQKKFKEKLGVTFRKYRILGACNPDYAYRVMQQEDKIGTLLPCSVVVQEAENGQTEVAVVNPEASMMAVKNESLAGIAGEVKTKLEKVIASL
ncbi:MAG TPA: DUF302 domain-containing protein [Bacteroidetes bacterium]|nr:DUF302 domain-containing protein [Bacteroidota bacterium]